jgi:hypothetical protein
LASLNLYANTIVPSAPALHFFALAFVVFIVLDSPLIFNEGNPLLFEKEICVGLIVIEFSPFISCQLALKVGAYDHILNPP